MAVAPVSFAADADALERVTRVLKKTPLIDGHNDLPFQYRRRVGNRLSRMDIADDLTRLERPTHTDIRRLRAGMMGGQFWSVYVPVQEYGGSPGDPASVLMQMDLVKRLAARYPKDLEMAYTAADVRRIHKAGRIASMMGIEGGHAIDNSLAVLRMMYAAGARYMTLTHGKSLAWADSATDVPRHGGLTEFGKEVVREMNRLGMLVDLSHVSTESMHDALDVTEAPVIFSHSSAKALVAHPRNVPDDVLLRVKENRGVVMVTFFYSYVSEPVRQHQVAEAVERARLKAVYPYEPTLAEAELAKWQEANPAPRATLAEVADHIDHVRRVAGIEHIGIGGDYDGMPPGPLGLEDVSTYPALFVELIQRGCSDSDIAAIAGNNVLRVMAEAEQVARRLQKERAPSDVLIEDLDTEAVAAN
ncbi:MAG: dipeptidase [Pseudomonadota bacterium]